MPFLKVDKGLADEAHGVQLMKPIDTLDDLLERAVAHGMLGTKMRSVVHDADEAGIRAIVEQQLEIGARIAAAGLAPILEPEVSIDSPRKEEAEQPARHALLEGVQGLPSDATYLLKLTLPTAPACTATWRGPRVVRVLALSGGYDRDEACERLAHDPAMIASFSRALLEGLRDDQSDAEFSATLEHSVERLPGVGRQVRTAGGGALRG